MMQMTYVPTKLPRRFTIGFKEFSLQRKNHMCLQMKHIFVKDSMLLCNTTFIAAMCQFPSNDSITFLSCELLAKNIIAFQTLCRILTTGVERKK